VASHFLQPTDQFAEHRHTGANSLLLQSKKPKWPGAVRTPKMARSPTQVRLEYSEKCNGFTPK